MDNTGEANGFQSNGYLLIQTSGGLNQQRTGVTICLIILTAIVTLNSYPGSMHEYTFLNHHAIVELLENLNVYQPSLDFYPCSYYDEQIIDAVVVARILNATLVIPQLDHKSFWKDSRYIMI